MTEKDVRTKLIRKDGLGTVRHLWIEATRKYEALKRPFCSEWRLTLVDSDVYLGTFTTFKELKTYVLGQEENRKELDSGKPTKERCWRCKNFLMEYTATTGKYRACPKGCVAPTLANLFKV